MLLRKFSKYTPAHVYLFSYTSIQGNVSFIYQAIHLNATFIDYGDSDNLASALMF